MRQAHRFTAWFNNQMRRRQMKAYEFAAVAGISGQTAYRYAAGETIPSWRKAEKIGIKLRLSPSHRRILVSMVMR